MPNMIHVQIFPKLDSVGHKSPNILHVQMRSIGHNLLFNRTWHHVELNIYCQIQITSLYMYTCIYFIQRDSQLIVYIINKEVWYEEASLDSFSGRDEKKNSLVQMLIVEEGFAR